MQLSLPKEVLAIVSTLQKGGYEAFIVGGAVRDLLIGRPTKDWDFTTNAQPTEIQNLFPQNFYENTFGTVGVAREHVYELFGAVLDEALQEHQEVYEITTYRSEGAYEDFRRPSQVEWGKSLHDDLQRRDFTINALALRVISEVDLEHFASLPAELLVEAELLDPFHGQADLQATRLRAVGNPEERFQEDALRMLRAVRFAAQLHFQLDQDVLIALQNKSSLIQYVSWERIREELLPILLTDQIEDAFTVMATVGLLQYILPEILPTKGVEQRGHHEYDVWKHSLRACQFCPTTDPVVKLAALLHDIAKPETQEEIPDIEGEYSFHNHEVIGARIARDIAYRFRLPKQDIQRVFLLVRWHMFYYQPTMTDAAIRRFIRRVGVENIEDMMAIRAGDRLGSGSQITSWRLEEMRKRIEEQLHQPLHIHDLNISGDEIMTILQIKPGPQVGQILNQLFEEILDDPEKNTHEYLQQRVQELAKETV